MAVGLGANKQDGSRELVAVFKYESTRGIAEELAEALCRRGFSAEVVDAEWPYGEDL